MASIQNGRSDPKPAYVQTNYFVCAASSQLAELDGRAGANSFFACLVIFDNRIQKVMYLFCQCFVEVMRFWEASTTKLYRMFRSAELHVYICAYTYIYMYI